MTLRESIILKRENMKASCRVRVLFAGVFFLAVSCNESGSDSETEKPGLPVVVTSGVSGITETGAAGGGTVSEDGGSSVTARGICWSLHTLPTLSDSKTTDGSGTGSFTSTLTNLQSGTTYYVRAWAVNSSGTGYGSEVSFKTPGAGSLTFNGITYKTVIIGTQEWMAENLRTSTYNDGSPIQNLTDNTAWTSTTTGAYCIFDNQEANVATYGYLYNFYAVSTGKLSPASGGWRVPSDADWDKLILLAGGTDSAGTKLKAKTGWGTGNGTDSYGFNAVSGGRRDYSNGLYYSLGFFGYWWSSSAYDLTYAWRRSLGYSYTGVNRVNDDKRYGFSVRLVRDL